MAAEVPFSPRCGSYCSSSRRIAVVIRRRMRTERGAPSELARRLLASSAAALASALAAGSGCHGACASTAAAETAASVPPLRRRFVGALGEEVLSSLELLAAAAAASEEGASHEEDKGRQSVVYLNHLASSVQLDNLWALAKRADDAAAWGLAVGFGLGTARPALRCLKAVNYSHVDSGAIGWHSDGETLITMMVMLSKFEGVDFEGGALEIRRGDRVDVADEPLRRGDVLIWRGWDEHRVTSVTRGLRRVLVVEWWQGEDTTEAISERPGDSLEGLGRIAAFDPLSAIAHSTLGELQLQRQNYWEAMASFLAAQELEPASAALHYNLGVVHNKQGNLERAVRSFTQSLRLDPESATTHAALASVYFGQGQVHKTLGSLLSALRLNPKDAGSHYNLGMVYKQEGESDKAIESFKAAIEIQPDDPAATYNLGLLQKETGDYESALESFYNLGVINLELGESQKALESFLMALDLEPEEALVNTALASIYFDQGDLEEADTHLTTALRTSPNFSYAHYHLGRVRREQGRLEEAKASLLECAEHIEGGSEEALSLGADLHAALGSVQLDLGEVPKALGSFRIALEMQPGHKQAAEGLSAARAAASSPLQAPDTGGSINN
eukprot:TRINITY_DN25371_c0_g1_i1.p1 TRINITY_DN25371_c0_g1~~TRINITY_DN25371_c0_g1_i1.p1  ORF type:complete len:627 (+),score=156.11 TRINITY_DN25371_c0_g1_i1:36-1883(+)